MAYIRKKSYQGKRRGTTYYYVVQSYRVEGKVQQTTLAYLGECPTVESAIRVALRRHWRAVLSLERLRGELAKAELRPMTPEAVAQDDQKWRASYAAQFKKNLPPYTTADYEWHVARAAKNRAEYERLQRRIDQLSRAELKHAEQLATLRQAAAALEITDPEALALPGSAAYSEIEETTRKSAAIFANRGRGALGLAAALMEADQLIRSAQKEGPKTKLLGTTPCF
jgi:hypothetical protein